MTTTKTNKQNWWGWGLLVFLALGIGIAAAIQYAVPVPASPVQEHFDLRRFWLYLHIISSILALVLGPFQFLKGFRDKQPIIHRWTGRAYLVLGVLPGAIGGLVIAQTTVTGLTGRFGFSMLAILWVITGLMAYLSIRNGKTQLHKRWMIRNYALTFAAVTLRLYLGVGIALLSPSLETAFGGDFDLLFMEIYRLVPWLSWVPNLLIAEYLMIQRKEWKFN